MTRNVTMTIRKPNGTLWASAAVTFDLLTKLTTRSTDSIFQYQVTVTTDVNGQATAALETPAEGDGAWLWRCTPPDDNWFDFALEYGAGAVDLSTIIAAISLGNIAPSAVAALLAAYLPLSGGTLTGDIAFSGAQTVDGVDVSALNTTVSGHTGATTNVHGITNTSVLATTGANTFTGNQTLGGNELRNYKEQVVTATVSGNYAVDGSAGNVFVLTLAGNHQISFTNMVAGRGVTVVFIQDGTGNRVPTWSGVTWPEGDAPTLSTAIGARDKLVFDSYNGSAVDGQVVGLAYA